MGFDHCTNMNVAEAAASDTRWGQYVAENRPGVLKNLMASFEERTVRSKSDVRQQKIIEE